VLAWKSDYFRRSAKAKGNENAKALDGDPASWKGHAGQQEEAG
jgi:hypothetical protein